MASSDPVVRLKIELRKQARARRAEARTRAGADADFRLAAHGLGFARPPAHAIVSGYAAMGDEINPLPLMTRLSAAGHRLALPVVVAKGQPLTFRIWTADETMTSGVWGIQEPPETAPAVDPDVLLVPLLAFDASGWRLGYGGGFFDRSLRGLRQRKPIIAIGVAFDEQEVDAVAHLDYDEPLDWVLTPSGPRRMKAT